MNCLSNKHNKENCPSRKRCMTLVKLPNVPQLLLPSAIPQLQIFSTKKISQSNSNLDQKVTATHASRPSEKSRYGKSFANKNQNQTQRANLNSFNQIFSVNHLQSTPKEQLQLIPVSFLNGKKAFDTYAMIDPGSQFTFILYKISEFCALTCEDQEATTHQYLNTEHYMPLSKISEPVKVAPYETLDHIFKSQQLIALPV